MSPPEFLLLTGELTTAAAVVQQLLGRQHRGRLRELARQWGLHYTPTDPFRLTPRVARHFPVPGAAGLRLSDLIYGQIANHFRCVFTCEYTVGVISGKRRVVRAGALRETSAHAFDITLGQPTDRIIDQYRELRPRAAED